MASWAALVLLAALQPLLVAASFEIGGRTFHHQWRSKATTKRSDMTATTVGDAIYLIAGCSGDQEYSTHAAMYLCSAATGRTEKYLPAKDAFESLPDAPRTRYRHAAAAVGPNIYLFGGVDIQDHPVPQVDVLHTPTGTWSTLDAHMPNVTTDLTAVALDGRIFVVGGYRLPHYHASDAVLVFDPSKAGPAMWMDGPSLLQGRGDAFAGVADGKIYIVGGFHHSSWEKPLAHVEMLNPSNLKGGWTARKGMGVARGDKALASLRNVIHVIGGEAKSAEGHSVPLTDVEAYDAATDTWHRGDGLPSQRFRFAAAAHGDSVFVFGGQGKLEGLHGMSGSKYPVLDTVEEYQEEVEGKSAVGEPPLSGRSLAVALLTGGGFLLAFKP